MSPFLSNKGEGESLECLQNNLQLLKADSPTTILFASQMHVQALVLQTIMGKQQTRAVVLTDVGCPPVCRGYVLPLLVGLWQGRI